jgi:hypothetical protein
MGDWRVGYAEIFLPHHSLLTGAGQDVAASKKKEHHKYIGHCHFPAGMHATPPGRPSKPLRTIYGQSIHKYVVAA